MKNAMLTVILVLFVSGCNSASEAVALGGAGGGPTVNTLSSSPGPCTVTSGVGGVNVSCPDGTSAFVSNGPQGPTGAGGTNGTNGTNGSNGTNGTNGAIGATGNVGPTGATSLFALRDGTGLLVGDYLMSPATLVPGSSYTVWDTANSGAVSYAQNTGLPLVATLYFASSTCSGAALIQKNVPQNTVFANNGVFYKVSSTVSTVSSFSYLPDGSTCVVSTTASSKYSVVGSYTNVNMPASLTLPVRIEKQ